MAAREGKKVVVTVAKKVAVTEAKKVAVAEAQKVMVRETVVRLATHMRGKELIGTGEKQRSVVFSFCYVWCLFTGLAIMYI